MVNEERDFIADLISASLSSSRADPLQLNEKEHGIFKTRSQLHVLLMMPFGSGKSTEIAKFDGKNIVEAKNYTLPGFVGSITKDGDYVEGSVVRSAGKTLIVDEGQNVRVSAREAMLSLLEGASYERDLGFKMRSKVRKKRKFYSVYAEGGRCVVKSRFSCMVSGLQEVKSRMGPNTHAWLSRFMPIAVNLTIEEAYKLSSGSPLFKNIKVSKYENTPIFDDYLKFLEVHYRTVKMLKFNRFFIDNPGFLRRSICDFSRVFSWDSRGNSVVDDWEKYVPYIPYSLYNYIASTLTLTEFRILCGHNEGFNGVEIARNYAVSEVHVSNTLKKLRGVGLV